MLHVKRKHLLDSIWNVWRPWWFKKNAQTQKLWPFKLWRPFHCVFICVWRNPTKKWGEILFLKILKTCWAGNITQPPRNSPEIKRLNGPAWLKVCQCRDVLKGSWKIKILINAPAETNPYLFAIIGTPIFPKQREVINSLHPDQTYSLQSMHLVLPHILP